MRTRYSQLRNFFTVAGLPVVATAVVLSSLVGCGGSSSSSSSSSPSPSPSPTTTPVGTLTGQITAASTRDTGGIESQVYTLNANGTSLKRLSNIAATESPGGWYPIDGSTIVFSSNRDNGGGLIANSDIYVMNADGSNIRRVTSNTAKNSLTPSWSPDGTKITFSYGKTIAVLPSSSTAVVPAATDILTDDTVVDAFAPVFSPGGTKIAFIANKPGATVPNGTFSRSVFVMNADGTGRTAVTAGDEYIHQVTWAPDGKSLVFDGSLDTGGTTSQRTQLYRVGVDGTGRTRLTNDSASDIGPVWSSDGRWVMFSSNRDFGGGSGGANPYDLYVIDPNTHGIVRVTTGGTGYFLGAQNWRGD